MSHSHWSTRQDFHFHFLFHSKRSGSKTVLAEDGPGLEAFETNEWVQTGEVTERGVPIEVRYYSAHFYRPRKRPQRPGGRAASSLTTRSSSRTTRNDIHTKFASSSIQTQQSHLGSPAGSADSTSSRPDPSNPLWSICEAVQLREEMSAASDGSSLQSSGENTF